MGTQGSKPGTKRIAEGPRLFYQRHLGHYNLHPCCCRNVNTHTCMHRHTMDLRHRFLCQIKGTMCTFQKIHFINVAVR